MRKLFNYFSFAEVSSDGNYLLVKPQPNFQANAIQMAILDGSVVVSELKEIFSADLGVRFIVRQLPQKSLSVTLNVI